MKFAMTTKRLTLKKESNKLTFRAGITVSVHKHPNQTLADLGVFWIMNELGFSGKVSENALRFFDKNENTK
jgi:hypothetical protein